jgi:nicotinamidase-related amidase
VPKAPLRLDASSTALVVIECQNGVVGSTSVLPDLAAAAAPVLPAIGRMVEQARNAGARVVHLTYVPALDNRSSNRRPTLFGAILDLMGDWTADHPATQVVDEIGVAPQDLVLPRHSGLSPTHSTELFKLLRNADVQTIIVAGVSLNIAIPVVCTEAVDEGFSVVVARDTVVGTPAEHAEGILRYTLPFIARITTADEVAAAWAGAREAVG